MNDEKSDLTYTVTVPRGKAGARLDKFLADELEDFSRTRLKALIEEGRVHDTDKPANEPILDPAQKVLEDQTFVVETPHPVAAVPQPQTIPLDIVYEDDDVIVVDKPAGLVVHPAPGSPDGTLVNALLGHARDQEGDGGLSGIGGVERPGIVHRLDKGTSGLMVVAKNDAAHQALSEQFAARTIDRAYYALVWGVPSPKQGEVSGNIGRSSSNRKKMAVVKSGGKPALTRYKVLRTFGGIISLVECRLATGRTHQIRVHMSSQGHPVVGDPLYGGGGKTLRPGLSDSVKGELKALNHQALHAYLLGFRVGKQANTYKFKRELPRYFNDLIEKLEIM